MAAFGDRALEKMIGVIVTGQAGRVRGEVDQHDIENDRDARTVEGIDKPRKDGPKIAPKYRSAVTSSAKVTFDPGMNEKAIDLTD